MSLQDSLAADRAATSFAPGGDTVSNRPAGARPVRGSRRYRLPGQGRTAGLSAATIAALADRKSVV